MGNFIEVTLLDDGQKRLFNKSVIEGVVVTNGRTYIKTELGRIGYAVKDSYEEVRNALMTP